MVYTVKMLWDLVNGCETHDDIREAVAIINRANLDIDLHDELMDALAYLSRELYRRK